MTYAVTSFADYRPARQACAALALAVGLLIIPVRPSSAATRMHASLRQGPHQAVIIVVAFEGGFVRGDDDRRFEVQMIRRLSEENIPGLRAASFSNWQRGKAQAQILRWLDTEGNGHLSAAEKEQADVILLGHSWGGSAAIKVAHNLGKRGVPVLLTVQIDSINKLWGHDCTTPANVANAVNFFQTRGLAHGCRRLWPADPGHTRILGNYRFDYRRQPPRCRLFSWANRHFLRTHNAMDCDPRMWSLVESDVLLEIRWVERGENAPIAPEYSSASLSRAGETRP